MKGLTIQVPERFSHPTQEQHIVNESKSLLTDQCLPDLLPAVLARQLLQQEMKAIYDSFNHETIK